MNLDTYFSLDVDERKVQTTFNFELIKDQLPNVSLFSEEEKQHLEELQKVFRSHVDEMSPNEYNKEMERLGIDLSWKSSQIEGNTYSLLETERLLRESKTADGKTDVFEKAPWPDISGSDFWRFQRLAFRKVLKHWHSINYSPQHREV